MLLKKHLQFSFLAILMLFALNSAINFWSNQKNDAAVEAMEQAVSRQALITSIKQGTADIQKQVSRLGQFNFDATAPPLPAHEIEQMNLRSATIATQIEMLHKLSDDEMRAKVEALQKSYADLAASWLVFNQNFGINHMQALTELALHTEPLSQHVLYEAVPVLEESEKQRIEAARKELGAAQWWTTGMASMIFIISLCAAAFIAVRTYLRLARGLKVLQNGLESINNGDSSHHIVLQSNDELGEIASSINNQCDTLRDTQSRLIQLDQELALDRTELEKQRQTSESLLRNILPISVAEEFLTKGSVEPRYLEDVTIIFTDFVNFSAFTEKLAAGDLVQMLHEYFSAFDQIAARYGLEKLKTIGDSYMCAGGLPERNPSHPVDAVMAAMEIANAVAELNSQYGWSIRVGIHTGHVIAGIVGKQKFSYDIWGESVNYASRLESSSEPNRITLSGQTHSRVKDFFECEKRSDISAKGVGKVDMYFVNGFLPSLIDDPKQTPPPAFLRRYRSYFQKDPPSFPAFLGRLKS